MSAIVLLLFLAFFVYLGSRLWRRDHLQPQMAGGVTHNDHTSFRTGDGSGRSDDRPRTPADAAPRSNNDGSV
ncbi:MAG: hypothetical protein U1E70_00535 [Acetobacteraceae bacterium]